jgi:hypothetical protein
MAREGRRVAIRVVVVAVISTLIVWWTAFRCHKPDCPCFTEGKAVAAAGDFVSREALSGYELTPRPFDDGDDWIVSISRKVVLGQTDAQAPMAGHIYVNKRTCRSHWGLNR